MRDINEVIRAKEAEIVRINEELAALRLTLRLLTEESNEVLSSGAQPSLRDEPAKVVTGRVKNFP
ncbi:MAG TPA: hypothetical protein VG498_05850 [Terriglobales bacterium]|nr:hypothetical protein [Terriglobales bacterium]